MRGRAEIVPADEHMHPVDPDDWAWNESWFFSWIDLDGGPAGFFRVGVLPNQRRAFPGLGMGFLREGPDEVRHLLVVDGSIDFDDDAQTIGSAWLRLEGEGSPPLEVTMKPIAASVVFDMAHTCEIPERWLYWRTLVEAHVPGWNGPCRGWFETSRYGTT